VRRVTRVLVTGAGGFIGHHLTSALVEAGAWVRGVDLRPPAWEPTRATEFLCLDLRERAAGLAATDGIDEVYHLAANMGGIGFIESHRAEIVRDNTLIDTHTLDAARVQGVRRLLYASSACVYPLARQGSPAIGGLREEDAYPADPEDGYGWEKLYVERMCRHYTEDFGLETRVVRFHNVFGPLGTWDGGREKSPAAICRKVAEAADGGEIEVWGDGEQTRSYCYVDDAVAGVLRLMRSAHREPLNVGQDRLVTVNGLVDMVAAIAGKRLHKRWDRTRPQGVRGRNSDNTRLRAVLGWTPEVSLEDGLRRTYAWIAAQVAARDNPVAGVRADTRQPQGPVPQDP
jgi:GDP-D-mannose 3', 5'-epimerase